MHFIAVKYSTLQCSTVQLSAEYCSSLQCIEKNLKIMQTKRNQNDQRLVHPTMCNMTTSTYKDATSAVQCTQGSLFTNQYMTFRIAINQE